MVYSKISMFTFLGGGVVQGFDFRRKLTSKEELEKFPNGVFCPCLSESSGNLRILQIF